MKESVCGSVLIVLMYMLKITSIKTVRRLILPGTGQNKKNSTCIYPDYHLSLTCFWLDEETNPGDHDEKLKRKECVVQIPVDLPGKDIT